MNLNQHSSLEGKHALLSPSKYHWVFDTDEDFTKRFCTSYCADIGTLLHEYARERIKYGYYLDDLEKKSVILELLRNGIPESVLPYINFDSMYLNLCTYVNDAIDLKMKPEVILYYSDVCFGTADALFYDEKKRFLRIHDLKTGSTPARMEQLYIYASLFFLDKHLKPSNTKIELRIYQNNDVITEEPGTDVIVPIIDKIKHFTDIATGIKGTT